MNSKKTIAAVAILALCALASAQSASPTAAHLPHLQGEALSGRSVVLPDDAKGKIALLAIGFSKKSGDVTRAWVARFRKDFGQDPRFAIYPIAELESAPRFVRGMILSSMRKSTPANERDDFITLFQDSESLKSFVGFAESDETYLLLLGSDGVVQWRGHGSFREDGYLPLQEAAKSLATH